MNPKHVGRLAIFFLGLFCVFGITAAAGPPATDFRDAFGPLTEPSVDSRHRRPDLHSRDLLAHVLFWNKVAVDASGLDHTPVAAGENRVFGHQLGPGRSSRAMAIVHIAMFDSISAATGGLQSYTGIPRARERTSVSAAVAQAAHDTLVAMFPSQAPKFDQLLAFNLRLFRDDREKRRGVELGRRAAAAILDMREGDGAEIPEPLVDTEFICSNDPYKWRQDPISRAGLAMGAYWDRVTPFVLDSAEQFRVPPPPDMNSAEYTEAYNEVKRLGGDGIVTRTDRTEDQTVIGIYWAYDGTPSLCAPPRLYNQIATHIALQRRVNGIEMARLLALVNVAMADAGIAIWESKYYYEVWRPVTGIREADAGTGPSGSGDDNSDTIGDINFSPLGAPASNLQGPNFTPPFPAYPSGHAGFGGALFQTLRLFFGTDNIEFTFVSDEYNGETTDNQGNRRPKITRRFRTLSEAEEENGQSRIYLGIHWSFDKTEGITQGRRVADHVYRNAFTRLRSSD